MSSPSNPVTLPLASAHLWMLVLAVTALPAQAVFKVVGADGRVTYTDRAPSAAEGKVTPLTATGSVVATNPSQLPFELRQVAARYPVTLYVVADCTPCDNARAFLRQRGIPLAERISETKEDAETVASLVGARDFPSLTIGAQVLRGFSAENWTAYLDSAGYPRESRLPAGYQYADATPMTQRAAATRPAAAPDVTAAPEAAAAPAARAVPAAPPGIRF